MLIEWAWGLAERRIVGGGTIKRQGGAWAILYYLKTRGREPGYIEKVDADVVTLEQLVLLAHKMEKEEEQAKESLK